LLGLNFSFERILPNPRGAHYSRGG
jgi:hypothetical protein